MSRLYIFDMDGTLLPQTTGMLQIANVTGHTKELLALETQYSNKQIDSEQFARVIFGLWKNLTPALIQKAFDDCPKLINIRETLAQIAKEEAVSCLITTASSFFAEKFSLFGFDHIFASNPFDLDEMRFSPEGVLHAQDKPILARQLCQKLGFCFEESVAFGDSVSDIPLFQSLIHTVSVNGDEAIKSYAKYQYVGRDLFEAFRLFSASI